MMMKISKKTIGEALRFCVTGVLATLLHYGIYLLLQKIIDENIAFAIGYFLSFLLNYVLSARFTFKEKTSTRNGLGFMLAHTFNFTLQMCLLNLFIYFGAPKELAPIPVYCIAVPVNFLVVRFVFRSVLFNGKE